MKESELINLVRKLGRYITDAPSKLPPNKISEDWTRLNLIDPLLRGLGWENPSEIIPGDSSINEDWIDYTLRPSPPESSSICIEAKHLLLPPPRDRNHEQIKKGLEQTKARGSDYFAWTNGDTWQLFAVKLSDAPMYEIRIGQVDRDESRIKPTIDWLRLLSRETVVNSPQCIADEIMANWKEGALPRALRALSGELAEETIRLMKSVLPPQLDISSEEILKFLKECRWEEIHTMQPTSEKSESWFKPCPAEWEKLVASRDPKYIRARETLSKDITRKLGEYLIGDKYEPFLDTVTYWLLGFKTRGKETKGPTGNAIMLYRRYGLIETENPQAGRGKITYKRVDDAMPYLKRILQSR